MGQIIIIIKETEKEKETFYEQGFVCIVAKETCCFPK